MEKDFIEKKTTWIRTIRAGESKTGYVREYEEFDTLSTLVSRFNNGLGRDRGVFLSSKRNWYEKSFTITCHPLETKEEHEKGNA